MQYAVDVPNIHPPNQPVDLQLMPYACAWFCRKMRGCGSPRQKTQSSPSTSSKLLWTGCYGSSRQLMASVKTRSTIHMGSMHMMSGRYEQAHLSITWPWLYYMACIHSATTVDMTAVAPCCFRYSCQLQSMLSQCCLVFCGGLSDYAGIANFSCCSAGRLLCAQVRHNISPLCVPVCPCCCACAGVSAVVTRSVEEPSMRR